MKKNKFLLAVLCISFLSPSLNSFADQSIENMSLEEAAQVEQIEQSLSDSMTLEKLQMGIDTVRESASAEELPALDSFQIELNSLKAELAAPSERKQTKIGKLATKVGLALNRGLIGAARPFIFGAGYLSGRFQSRKHLNENGNNKIINLMAHLANRLKDKGEAQAAALADRIVRGDKLNSAEIELLVAAFPKLDMQDWEPVAAGTGLLISVNVGSKILTAAGLGAVSGGLLLVAEAGIVASWVPCLIAQTSENPNENTVKYCDQMKEEGYSKIMTSRIRGYLRGVRDRNASSNP